MRAASRGSNRTPSNTARRAGDTRCLRRRDTGCGDATGAGLLHVYSAHSPVHVRCDAYNGDLARTTTKVAACDQYGQWQNVEK